MLSELEIGVSASGLYLVGPIGRKDHRSVTDANQHDLAGRARHVSLAVHDVFRNAEVLTRPDLDTFASALTELECDGSLEDIADRDVVAVMMPTRHRLGCRLDVSEPVAVPIECHPTTQAWRALVVPKLVVSHLSHRFTHGTSLRRTTLAPSTTEVKESERSTVMSLLTDQPRSDHPVGAIASDLVGVRPRIYPRILEGGPRWVIDRDRCW
jgi:hypothetical protein